MCLLCPVSCTLHTFKRLSLFYFFFTNELINLHPKCCPTSQSSLLDSFPPLPAPVSFASVIFIFNTSICMGLCTQCGVHGGQKRSSDFPAAGVRAGMEPRSSSRELIELCVLLIPGPPLQPLTLHTLS